MSCRGIHDGYAILDCSYCGGSGGIMVLQEGFPVSKKTCEQCKGTCLVRVPLKDVPILNYMPDPI